MTRIARRLPLLLLALLLAVPALAKPGELTLTGVITDVTGNQVSLNGGIVVLDVTNATILSRGDGGTSGVGALVVGAPVMATVNAKNSDGSLVAVTVLVGSADAIEVRGTIDAIDTTAGTLTVMGLTITTDAHTVFTGSTSRGPVASLADLQVGDTVAVEAVRSGTALVAQHVSAGAGTGSGDDGQNEDVTFAGRVDATGDTSWTISRRTVAITSSTQITGSPVVGDLVKVTATKDSSGALTALTITKLGGSQGGGQPMVAVHGTLQAKASDSWTISGTVVKIDSSTIIKGNPQVGDRVNGIAKKNGDGTLTAVLLVGGGQAPTGGGSEGDARPF